MGFSGNIFSCVGRFLDKQLSKIPPIIIHKSKVPHCFSSNNINYNNYNLFNLGRLLLSELLPNVDKCMYLDSDMIVFDCLLFLYPSRTLWRRSSRYFRDTQIFVPYERSYPIL